jgi:hypothetical protein
VVRVVDRYLCLVNRFYNPDLTKQQAAALDRENMAVLFAVQAALGNISPDVRAVFVDARSRPVVLHFVLAEGTAEACADDMEDTLAEFEAQTWVGGPDLEVVNQTHIEEIPRNWTDLGWRPIYWAKNWSAWRE